MLIEYTAREGGRWHGPIHVNIAKACKLMDSNRYDIVAIKFSNGLIYDNVLRDYPLTIPYRPLNRY